MRSRLDFSRRLWLAAVAAFALEGCSIDLGSPGEGLGRSIACAFDLELGPVVDGDDGVVRAQVDCRGGGDCADRRTVQRGAVMDFTIEIPAPDGPAALRVESTDSTVISIEGFASSVDMCDGAAVLEGSASFDAEGEAAVVVLSGEDELDRFTVQVREPARLELEASAQLNFFGGGEYDALDEDVFDRPHEVRAIVRSAQGERLVGGAELHWSIDDSEVAKLYSEQDSTPPTGSHVVVLPEAVGTTTLRVRSGELSASLPLRVTGVHSLEEIAAEGADGGVHE